MKTFATEWCLPDQIEEQMLGRHVIGARCRRLILAVIVGVGTPFVHGRLGQLLGQRQGLAHLAHVEDGTRPCHPSTMKKRAEGESNQLKPVGRCQTSSDWTRYRFYFHLGFQSPDRTMCSSQLKRHWDESALKFLPQRWKGSGTAAQWFSVSRSFFLFLLSLLLFVCCFPFFISSSSQCLGANRTEQYQ